MEPHEHQLRNEKCSGISFLGSITIFIQQKSDIVLMRYLNKKVPGQRQPQAPSTSRFL